MDFCEESGESRMWILGEYSRYIGCQPFVRTLHNVHLSFARSGVVCPGRAAILEKPRRVVSSLDPGVRERDQTIAQIGFPDRPFESRFYCGYFTESRIA